MYEAPLDQVKLPRNMSADLARDLARIITGHARETPLVRYLAMALHYVSWTLNRDASLRDYEQQLMAVVQADSAHQVLEMLALPTAFALQGMQNGVPKTLVRDAQRSAAEWRKALEDKPSDVFKLHQRAMAILCEKLDDEHELQESVANDMREAVLSRHPEVQMRDAAASQRPARITNLSPQIAAVMPNDPEIRQFASPVDALQFVFSRLYAARGGAPGALAPVMAASPTQSAQPRAPAEAEVDLAKPAWRLFDPAEAVAHLQRMPSTGAAGEGNGQQRRLLEVLGNDSGWRSLTEVPEGEPLASLYQRFPHFTEVLDYVAGSLALAACGEEGRPARLAPILLRGAPGTGKTYFAQELAKALGTYFVERDLSVTSEAFVLTGMDSSWRNSKPGVVFDALVNGKTANPLICLNEVDKARTTGTHNSPMAALYALLEPTSAERFVDEFVPVKLDTSRVLWVLTANDGEIPDPILSRLEVFAIAPPTMEQCRAIAQSVWTNMCQRLLPKGHGFADQLQEPLLSELERMSPRIMRKALTSAASHAVLAGRKFLLPEDLSQSGTRYQECKRRPIGFCADV